MEFLKIATDECKGVLGSPNLGNFSGMKRHTFPLRGFPRASTTPDHLSKLYLLVPKLWTKLVVNRGYKTMYTLRRKVDSRFSRH